MLMANLNFRDPATQVAYTDTNKLDFGALVAGQSSEITEIQLSNDTGVSVDSIVVGKTGENTDATLDISYGNDPEPVVKEWVTEEIRNSGLPWFEYLVGGTDQYIVQSNDTLGVLYKNGSGYIVHGGGTAKRYTVNKTDGTITFHSDLAKGGALTIATNFELIASSDHVYDDYTLANILIKQPLPFRSRTTLDMGTLANGGTKNFFTRLNMSSTATDGASGEVQITVDGTEGL